jgi:hypothetical protein
MTPNFPVRIMEVRQWVVNAAQLRREPLPTGAQRLDAAQESADKAAHASRAHTRRKYSVRHYCNELADSWRAAASLPDSIEPEKRPASGGEG